MEASEVNERRLGGQAADELRDQNGTFGKDSPECSVEESINDNRKSELSYKVRLALTAM